LHCETREMGVVNVRPDQRFDFVVPILGFEPFRSFAVLPDHGAPPFHWLQSLEDKSLAFPLVEAAELEIVYEGGEECLAPLGALAWDEVQCWIIVVIPADGSPMRVNLRAPIVVNPLNSLAGQIIQHDEYPVSCALTASFSLTC